ncbi:hypothetical protein [Thermaurantiacus sp.]
MSLLYPERVRALARIEIEQTDEHFHAHVELAGDPPIHPGDRVRVLGEPIPVPLNSRLVLDRPAIIERASALVRWWTRLLAYLELTELCEVSFSPGRVQ